MYNEKKEMRYLKNSVKYTETHKERTVVVMQAASAFQAFFNKRPTN